MANAAFGELDPNVIIQEDTRACLSACLLSQVDPNAGISEEDITDVLTEDGLHERGIGADLFYTRIFDNSIRKIGLDASPVYDGRLLDEAEDPPQEETRIVERLAKIQSAIKDGQAVILAFPKRREGQAAFSHYVVATGYEETKTGSGVVIIDPSDVDGGIRHPSWEELRDYVTPTSNHPVMAWGIGQLKEETTETSHGTSDKKDFPGFSLMARPMYSEQDTGKAIPPGTDHPSSVVMPNSYISRQYNEYGGLILSRQGEHPIGYPRFVVPPAVKELALVATGHFDSLPFPTQQTAEATLHPEKMYGDIHTKNPNPNSVAVTERDGLFWLRGTHFNLDSWQNIGLGISSRQATAVMEGRPENDLLRRDAAEQKIKALMEKHTGARQEDIYLFPTGMAALYWLNRVMISTSDGTPGAQFGFPYTDTYDLRKFGPGRDVRTNILDFRDGDYERMQQTADSGQRLRGVITEYPTNPLLWTPDFDRLDHALDGATPIIIDDTIGTMFNLDDNKLPESVVARSTSLTKFVSSVGDAMGGSIILRPDSPHYEQFKAALDGLYQDTLWYEDAERLASNSDLFEVVMPAINQNADELAQWLNQEWTGEGKALHDVYYPSLTSKRAYDAVKKREGGYSGLMSLRFNDPRRGYRFFDELEVTKGPSLGTYYTLASLYTLMAHKILSSVDKFGVTPDLVRLSVGIEDIDDLKDRFDRALKSS